MHRFDEWINLKKILHTTNKIPFFKEREVWWTSIGHNVGTEQNGKNRKYDRPVLILRKFNNQMFFGLPLTTNGKEGRYYYKLNINDRNTSVVVSQLRLWDAKRLIRKMAIIDAKIFDEIIEKTCSEIKTVSDLNNQRPQSPKAFCNLSIQKKPKLIKK